MRKNSQDSFKQARAAFQVIPGVGPAMADDFVQLGFTRPEDLRGQDPEALYERMKSLSGGSLDRCVLYVFRLAVWWAEDGLSRDPDMSKLKWWNWTDEKISARDA